MPRNKQWHWALYDGIHRHYAIYAIKVWTGKLKKKERKAERKTTTMKIPVLFVSPRFMVSGLSWHVDISFTNPPAWRNWWRNFQVTVQSHVLSAAAREQGEMKLWLPRIKERTMAPRGREVLKEVGAQRSQGFLEIWWMLLTKGTRVLYFRSGRTCLTWLNMQWRQMAFAMSVSRACHASATLLNVFVATNVLFSCWMWRMVQKVWRLLKQPMSSWLSPFWTVALIPKP